MLRLSLPHLDEDAVSAAAAVMRSGQLVHGAQGEAFEAELAAYLGCRHVVLVSSGTAALHLALLALGVGPGDAVLVPDFTFPASGNAILLAGATPVLVDVDAGRYTLTAATLRRALDAFSGPQRPRAVMPVHEFGCPVDMDGVTSIARAAGLAVVEDAACAIGAQWRGRRLGTLGEVGCFSMHPRKTLTTGEGGFLVTGDDAIAQRLRRLRSHGIERTGQGVRFREPGFNYRLTDFQAALGRAQLPHLDAWIAARRALARAYHAALGSLEGAGRLLRPEVDVPGHSWQTYMVVLAEDVDRTALIGALAADGVETNLGAQCLSDLSPFAGVARPGDQASRLFARGLALPFCEQYGAAEVERVVAALTRALQA